MQPPLRTLLDGLGEGLHRMRLADARAVVVKRRRAAPAGFFAMEAHGLALLRAASGLRTPQVIAVAEDAIVLEDLGQGRPARSAWERAGHALARQHASHGEGFGLDRDGWCGDSTQVNTPDDDGCRFFAQCRLLPQAQRAFDAGRLVQADLAALERLCANLRERVPLLPPALLHGDLWMGNLHACADGELALIDAAAVHYGWAETELAMLTLFGEPPPIFFAAYEAAADIDRGWRQRASLYNLHHLLNHLNLFGTGYLSALRAALRAAA